MISRLAIMMGGRVAEEMKFGKENITSGAASDIEQATKLARAMVTRWGFSDKLGQVAYGENQEEVFLGHSVARTQNVSEETAQLIDAEVRRLIDDAYTTARQILTKKKKEWIALAEGLLEYETLSGDEIKQLLAGAKPSRDLGDDTPTSRGSAVPKAGAGPRRKKGPEPEGGMEPQPQG
jgi:cell division protease FtsH